MVYNLNADASQLTAAERIRAEKKISGGYRFAPGITIHPPSKKDAETMAVLMEGIDINNPSDEEMAQVLRVLLGDQYQPVMDFLDDFPVEGYPDLFADLFTNLLQLVPHAVDVDAILESAEAKWRVARPDLFASTE
jgi:hypothetical protein